LRLDLELFADHDVGPPLPELETLGGQLVAHGRMGFRLRLILEGSRDGRFATAAGSL
jgi:hypothetical protein